MGFFDDLKKNATAKAVARDRIEHARYGTITCQKCGRTHRYRILLGNSLDHRMTCSCGRQL